MGVEIRESAVSAEEFADMERFVREYLVASVESEDDGGRMRWYPWHSAEYRFNHIRNVVEIAERIAREEGADVDVVRVAALFHDVATDIAHRRLKRVRWFRDWLESEVTAMTAEETEVETR